MRAQPSDPGTQPVGSRGQQLFLIARDDPRDGALEAAATEQGFIAHRLGLLETEPGSDVGRLTAWLKAPPERAAVAWTSRRAAQALAATIPSRRGALEALPLFALGGESAAPIAAAGLRVDLPKSGLGAEHLAAHIAARAARLGIRSVLALQGDRPLPGLVDGLRAAGLTTETLEVYRIRFLKPDVREIVEAMAEARVAAAAFFSPSGVEALERLLEPGVCARFRTEVVALARGETTYHALVDRGYHRAMVPDPLETPFEAFAQRTLSQFRCKSR